MRSTTAKVIGGKTAVTIVCSGDTGCAGTIAISAIGAQPAARKHKRRKRSSTLVIARGTYAIGAGQSETLTLRLTAKGKALLTRHRGRLVTTVSLTPSGRQAAKSGLTLIKAKPKPHKRHKRHA